MTAIRIAASVVSNSLRSFMYGNIANCERSGREEYKLVGMSLPTDQNYDCIVSLTSWRGRLYSEIVQLALFALIRQQTTYRYKVVLVLSEEEFPKKEAEVPKNILLMASRAPNFEILWCGRNSRALKKLTAPMAAYPTLPIITTDDDIIVKEDFVQSFMDCHMAHPKDVIYAYCFDFPENPDIKISGWGRLFPPFSLYPLDESLFYSMLHGAEDDLWNGIRVWLAGTSVTKLGKWPFVDQIPIGDTAFYHVYLKINAASCYNNLIRHLGII